MKENMSIRNQNQEFENHETLNDLIADMSADQEFVDLMADARTRREVIEDLVKLRKEVADMSLREFARVLELSAATVSEFEKQSRDPRLSTIQRYARAVGYEVVLSLQPIHRAALVEQPLPN